MKNNAQSNTILIKRENTIIKPIVITKFERLGEKCGYCDCAEGFFVDDTNFLFEVYLDDVPSKDTYKGTRISELYIKFNDGASPSIQWSWPTFNGEEPDWDYGKQLLAYLLSEIEPSIRSQIPDNLQYCTTRIDHLVNQLIKSGINHTVVVSAMKESLNKAESIRAD